MQIQLDNGQQNIQIIDYCDDHVVINNESYRLPLLLTRDEIVSSNFPESPSLLTKDHLLSLFKLEPEVILLGTGAKSQFLPTELDSFCHQHNQVIDCMATDAACRTFMLLASEQRRVIALLF